MTCLDIVVWDPSASTTTEHILSTEVPPAKRSQLDSSNDNEAADASPSDPPKDNEAAPSDPPKDNEAAPSDPPKDNEAADVSRSDVPMNSPPLSPAKTKCEPRQMINTKNVKPRGVKVEKKENPNSSFLSHCRPQGLHDLIKDLSDEQKKDVVSIGFGGLLQLKLTRCFNQDMLKWLLDNFDGSSRMLTIDNFRQFPVTADDVYDIFMLPRREGCRVPVYGRSENTSCRDTFTQKYKFQRKVSNLELSKLIKGRLRAGGDDFKRMFVLFSLASFLCPTSNRNARIHYFKALEVVENIPTFDWCTLVLGKLCDSVLAYRSGVKNVTSCTIILQLVYLHRLVWRGVCEPRSIPLIQHWNDEKMKSRCAQESRAKHYGSGELVCNVYPLSNNGIMKTSIDEGKSDRDVHDEDQYQEIKMLLLSLHEEAKDFSEMYLLKIQKLLEGIEVTSNSQLNSTPDPCLSNTQKFYMNPKLHAYVDKLVKHVQRMKELASQAPTFNILSPDPVIYETNLSGDEEDWFQDDDFVDITGNHDAVSDQMYKKQTSAKELDDAMKSIGSNMKSSGKDVSNLFWMINDDIGHVSKLVLSNKRLCRSMPQTHLEVVDFCFYDGDESTDLGKFYAHGEYIAVSKADIMSLMPNKQIYMPIINAWCLEVNNNICVDDSRSRFVFNLEHSVLLRQITCDGLEVADCVDQFFCGWNQWITESKCSPLSVDMIFVPFCVGYHYAMVAINFVDCKLQYLDNLKHNADDDVYIECAQLLCTIMARFLVSKEHPKANAITGYTFEKVLLKWQTGRPDNDCGVYLMHHMKHFNGSPYSTLDMTKADIRLVLRAEICAIIILSNLNEIRGEVIQKVYDFYVKKPGMIKMIAAKKKENTLKAAAEKRKLAAEKLKEMGDELGRGKRKNVA